MEKALASRRYPYQTEAAPTLTRIQATKAIRVPALTVDTPNSLDKAIKEAILHNQADLGIQLVLPGSMVEEATLINIQRRALHTEDMVVMVVMGVMALTEAMGVTAVIQVDTSTITQTTKS